MHSYINRQQKQQLPTVADDAYISQLQYAKKYHSQPKNDGWFVG